MKLGLIFTNDWELFGDGSGDFWEVQYEPMSDMLALMDKFRAKMTIMAEVGQQLAYKSISDSDSEAKAISDSWEELIIRAIKTEHDVQLHIHPQWFNAKYNKEKWELQNDDWAIGKLDESQIKHMIQTGKSYLEELIQTVSSDYLCNCFRAGAYYIEPSCNVIKVLKELEFLCDTSVTKCMVSQGYFDFRNAHSNVLPYFIDNDVKYLSSSEKSFVEFPIYSKLSYESLVLKKFLPKLYTILTRGNQIPQDELSWARQRDKLKNSRYPKENRFYKQNQKKDIAFYLKHFLTYNAQQLDYDYIYPSEFINVLEGIFYEHDLKKLKDDDITIPIVSSGHIKDIPDTSNMEKLLTMINQKLSDKVVFWTLTDAVKYYYKNQSLFT
jgi:hypothetical protein